jgi:hypothetical protein
MICQGQTKHVVTKDDGSTELVSSLREKKGPAWKNLRSRMDNQVGQRMSMMNKRRRGILRKKVLQLASCDSTGCVFIDW